jgi:type II secretory pathway pseudopilin PulG
MRVATPTACFFAVAVIGTSLQLHSVRRAKKAVDVEDARVLRQAVDAYRRDKGKAPKSPTDLVEAGYLESEPTEHIAPQEIDPIPPHDGLAAR